MLVKIVKSRILTEWLNLKLNKDLFRYDFLNRMFECYKSVPACRKDSLSKIRDFNKGTDHTRFYYFTFNRQPLQRKCILNKVIKNKGLIFRISFFKKRYLTCKASNNFIKKDADINNVSEQNVRNKNTVNLGNLILLKKEIQCQSKKLTPLLVNCIDKGIWPMLRYNKDIRILVKNRQKYLSLLSNQYGLRSKIVMQQIDKWLCKVDLRIMAIELVYRSRSNFTAGVDNLKLK